MLNGALPKGRGLTQHSILSASLILRFQLRESNPQHLTFNTSKMRNKGLIIALTVVVTALCAYFLFFTYVSRGVQQKAVDYATTNGKLNEAARQHYLDSVWRAPVF